MGYERRYSEQDIARIKNGARTQTLLIILGLAYLAWQAANHL